MDELSHTVRRATDTDLPTLQAALAWAIDWRTPGLTATPAVRIEETGHTYLLADWGRIGDTAVLAQFGDQAIGVAWYRFWTDESHSYGYVDSNTPEMGIGVDPAFRGRGVGTSLVTRLLQEAEAQGVQALSLSVESDNPAMHLYDRLGFERHAQVDGDWTMVKRLGA